MHRSKYQANKTCPLDDVRVVDLSRVMAGNTLSHYLADFGAEILKIEPPGNGDPLRAIGGGQLSPFWKVMGRNKKSVALNLRAPEGMDLLKKMVAEADVFVENFRPGVLEKMGLGPAVLLGLNPRLVIVRISGWGATGPYAHKPGFGTLIEAFSGFAAKNGFPDRPPLLPNLGLADTVCGLTGAVATLVALREVEMNGGAGQVIDLSILDAMVAFLATDAAQWALSGVKPGRAGNRGQVAAPRNLYRTRDDCYVAMSASTQSMAEKLFRVIGRPDLVTDPRFATPDARMENADELDRIIEDDMMTRTLAENLAFFDAHGVTAGPVYDVEQLCSDPHVIERETLVEIEDRDVGWLPMPSPPARMSATPAAIRRPAPALGADTAEVLAGLGLGDDQIAKLEASGVVSCGTQGGRTDAGSPSRSSE